jgi:hypothetical protein
MIYNKCSCGTVALYGLFIKKKFLADHRPMVCQEFFFNSLPRIFFNKKTIKGYGSAATTNVAE